MSIFVGIDVIWKVHKREKIFLVLKRQLSHSTQSNRNHNEDSHVNADKNHNEHV